MSAHRSPVLSGFLVIIVTALALAAVYLTKPDPPRPLAPEPEPTPIHIRQLQKSALPDEVRIFGESQAWKSAWVPAESSGRIVWRAPEMEAGGLVSGNQVLVRLNATPVRLARDAASAAVTVAESQAAVDRARVQETQSRVTNAKEREAVLQRDYERNATLVEAGDLAPNILDQIELQLLAVRGERETYELNLASAEAAHAASLANVKQAQASLDQAEDELSRTEVRAPFAGEVSRPQVDVGDWVVPGTPICRLVDRSELRIEVQIPTEQSLGLNEDASVEVHFSAWENGLAEHASSGSVAGEGNFAKATWVGLDPVAHSASRSRTLTLKVENQQLLLPAGAFAEVEVNRGPKEAVWLRAREFTVQGNELAAFVVIDHERAEQRTLTLGPALIDQEARAWYPVLNGVAAGEWLAIDNLEMLEDQAPVRVLDSAQTP